MPNVQDQVSRSLKLVGRVLGDKFKLTACIGIGGSGAVYRADQMALGRTVAVKILNEELSADARMIKRFRDEAMSASRLNHPNCVSIIDYGQAQDGLLYLAMEYVKGPTLTQLLVNENPLPVSRVADIIMQALSGIEEAHLAGVIHADLKSDNIILDQRRAGVDVVKIVDFGIARLANAVRDPDDRSISGTPEYMAPEVISGAPPSFASDIYAVGIILYELLAYKTPFFAGTTTEILSNHLKAMIPTLSSRREQVPRELDSIVARALAKHPEDRFVSAAEMRAALGKVQLRSRTSTADKCPGCGTSCAPSWKFCPECGAPRRRDAPGLPAAPAPAPAPAAPSPADVLPLPFLGRAAELAALLEHMRQPPGPAAGLLVHGFEGSGRSALLRRAYEKLGHEARVVYQIGPDPSGLAAPYYPIRSLLAAVLQLPPVASEGELRDAVLDAGLAPGDVLGIAQLFGHPTTLLELEPEVRRREITWSALRALGRAAAQGPVTVVCEDIDRFDDPSLEILRRACTAPELALPPLVMTATAALAAHWPPEVPRLEVGALEAGDLAQIVGRLERAGVRSMPSAQALFETTRASPGHIEHVVRYLLEGGRAEDTASSLPDLVAARLSMLAQQTRDVLQAASVLGVEPQIDLLRAMLPLPGAALEAAMADAERSGLIGHDPSGELAFTSRLARDIVYDATPAHVRRSLHAAAAAAVEAVSPDLALLGHHHDLAGHAKDAISLLRRAGDSAAEQLDDAGAAQLYYRALVAVRQAVLSGDDDGSAESQFVQLSVRLAEVLRTRGETALARGVLAEARDWSGSSLLVASIERASAAIALGEGDADGAVTGLRRGLGRAITTGDMSLVCELYLDLATSLQRGGRPEEALRELTECIDLVTLGEGPAAIDGPEPLWRILRAQAELADRAGEAARALRLAEAALFHAQRVGSRYGAARVQLLLAQLCDKSGPAARAERYRQHAVGELRDLGDRRPTAEILRGDAPRRAPVAPGRLRDTVSLPLGKQIS